MSWEQLMIRARFFYENDHTWLVSSNLKFADLQFLATVDNDVAVWWLWGIFRNNLRMTNALWPINVLYLTRKQRLLELQEYAE